MHIEDTPEARLGARCAKTRVGAKQSSSRGSDARGQELFVKLFRNMSTSNRTTVHAEQLFVQIGVCHVLATVQPPTDHADALPHVQPLPLLRGAPTRPLNMSCAAAHCIQTSPPAFGARQMQLHLSGPLAHDGVPGVRRVDNPQHYAAKARNAQHGSAAEQQRRDPPLRVRSVRLRAAASLLSAKGARGLERARRDVCGAPRADEFVARVLAKYSDANGGGVGEWLCQCCSG